MSSSWQLQHIYIYMCSWLLPFLLQSADEGTSPTVQSFSDRVYAQTVDLSELLNTLQRFGFPAFCCRALGLLLNFWPMGRGFSRKLEWSNFKLKFCPQIGLISTRISPKFEQQPAYLYRDIHILKKCLFWIVFQNRGIFMTSWYFDEDTLVLAQTLGSS